MDTEKAEHLNLIAVAIVLLLALTYFTDQFAKNLTISFSIGLVAISLVFILCLFRELIGMSLLGFALAFVLITVMLGDWSAGLLISSLIAGVFILFTLLTR